MTTALYYFSGTGNSLKVAKDLAQKLDNASLTNIVQVERGGTHAVSADIVGIIFPVYMWGYPLIVERFISKLDISASAYVFAVATYGGFPGGALLLLNELLKKKGRQLFAGFGVQMPGNYTPMYGAKPERVQNDLFAKEADAMKNIVKIVTAKEKAKIASNNFLINALFSSFMFKACKGQIPKMDEKFMVEPSCTSCGLCVKLCPAKNIVLEKGRPVWQKHCEQCMACLQWCPVEAIQYGPATKGRKRYHHPDITAEMLSA